MHTQRLGARLLLIALAVVAAAIFSCAAGGLAVQRRALPPPALDIRLAGVGIVAKTTNVPSCTVPLLPCAEVAYKKQHQQMYAVWVVWREAEGPGQRPGARRVFAFWLGPNP
jgi:hypothetical protein